MASSNKIRIGLNILLWMCAQVMSRAEWVLRQRRETGATNVYNT